MISVSEGNYRVVQDIKRQNLVIIENAPADAVDTDDIAETNNVLKIVLIFSCVILIIGLGLNLALHQGKKEAIDAREKKIAQKKFEA